MSWHRRLASGLVGGAVLTALPASAALNTDIADRLARWNDGWAKGRTGFHLEAVNANLASHADAFLPVRGKPATVLVPLCGKTIDMPWLANRGHVVVGVEGVEQAVQEFATEHRRTERLARAPLAALASGAFIPSSRFNGARPGEYFGTGVFGTGYYKDDGGKGEQQQQQQQQQLQRQPGGPMVWAQPDRPLAFVQGDFFALRLADMCALVARLRDFINDEQAEEANDGPFTHVWDRASLVAIEPSHREEYVAQTDALLAPGGKILLNTLEYDQTRMGGPPFSVDATEVRRLYEPLGYVVADLQRSSARDVGVGKFKALDVMEERVFLLRKPKKKGARRRYLGMFGPRE